MTAKHSRKTREDQKLADLADQEPRAREAGQATGEDRRDEDPRDGVDAARDAGAPAAPAGDASAAEQGGPEMGGGENRGVAEALATVQAELRAQEDRYLRLAAEFDNYRKRNERERAETSVRAQAQLVERLLDAIDDLQRVTLIDPAQSSTVAVLEGIQLVERKLMRSLEAVGLEPIEAQGKPFDPEIHEALAAVTTENQDEDDTVADVFQSGYRFRGSLLRPARVRVKKHG